MANNPAYMDNAHAATLDPKMANSLKAKEGLNVNMQSASAASLTNYTVPSLDGKPLSAVPKSLALKFKPPTIAVVYLMKDSKSGRNKKYIHEIPIKFDDYADPNDIDRLCDELCRKEQMYLNPAFINKNQVSAKNSNLLRFLIYSESCTTGNRAKTKKMLNPTRKNHPRARIVQRNRLPNLARKIGSNGTDLLPPTLLRKAMKNRPKRRRPRSKTL